MGLTQLIQIASTKGQGTQPQWPEPLANEAYYGLAGEIVHAIEPHSESDPAGILIHTLTMFGNVVGRNAYFSVESD